MLIRLFRLFLPLSFSMRCNNRNYTYDISNSIASNLFFLVCSFMHSNLIVAEEYIGAVCVCMGDREMLKYQNHPPHFLCATHTHTNTHTHMYSLYATHTYSHPSIENRKRARWQRRKRITCHHRGHTYQTELWVCESFSIDDDAHGSHFYSHNELLVILSWVILNDDDLWLMNSNPLLLICLLLNRDIFWPLISWYCFIINFD